MNGNSSSGPTTKNADQAVRLDELLQEGFRAHQGGKLKEAETFYLQVLKIDSDHADANHLLGLIAHQVGKNELSVQLISKAIQKNNVIADYHFNLGNTLHQLGQLDDAVASYRNALVINANEPDYHVALGNLLHQQDRLDEAAASYRNALAINPDDPDFHCIMGNVLHQQGQLDDAVTSYKVALRINPGLYGVHTNLGNALRSLGRLDESVSSHQKAIAIKPDYAEAHSNLGRTLHKLSRLDDAVASYREAIRINPCLYGAHSNLGNALREQKQWDDAIASYRESLQIKPKYAEAHYNLGNVLKDAGRPDEASVSYREALALKPDFAEAHSKLLLHEIYQVGVTTKKLYKLHLEWDERHGKKFRAFWPKFENPKDSAKRLRIGFVSPDLGRHPTGYFLIRLLENKLQHEVEFICYSDREPDDLTERIKEASDKWRYTHDLSNEDLEKIIRGDQIDILFDLAGHFGKNRLLMFARKLAPIQVVWAGYVATTGLKAMDYFLSDAHSTPLEEDKYYQEKIIRMPDGWICYDPPDYAPAVGPLPLKIKGLVTFGSFNKSSKINETVMALWSKILKAVPNSQLVLKYRAFDTDAVRDRLLPSLSKLGLDPSRLILEGRSPHLDLLARYKDIDIALDPFPYSGGLTTCEALWMGVPVITMPGKSFASRHSLSHLSSLGLSELVATDPSNYVEIASALTNDVPRLEGLRSELRKQMAKSPLCDGPRFSKNFTNAMREIWREWCMR